MVFTKATLCSYTVLGISLMALGACQSAGGLPELEGGLSVGLKRGAHWTGMTVQPPYAIGPDIYVTFKKNKAVGTIQGRAFNLRFDRRGISGQGPYGQVVFDVQDVDGEFRVEGSWNGTQVRIVLSPSSLVSTIVVWRAEATSGFGSASGPEIRCNYDLMTAPRKGVRHGSSACGAQQEETILELPPALRGWLSSRQMAVVLAVLLSSPRLTTLEQRSFTF